MVFDYLCDMQKFCSIHPIIHKIEPKGGNSYLVHETLKVGFIPVSFTYRVNVESNAQTKTVSIKAKIMGGTGVKMVFNISELQPNRSAITESINFSSKLPVVWMMKKVFREQHAQLFKNMEAIS